MYEIRYSLGVFKNNVHTIIIRSKQANKQTNTQSNLLLWQTNPIYKINQSESLF